MSLDSPDKASIHQRVRRQHANELTQDYVEAIHEILARDEPVTVRKLQVIFGVSHVTVIRALSRLEDQGLTEGRKSKHIQLTKQGNEIAIAAAERHELLRKFFVALGVNKHQADADAEGAEHHLSKETLDAIRKFLKKTQPFDNK